VFLSGQQALTYQVSSGGALAVNGIKNSLFGSSAGSTALRTLMTQTSNNVFEAEYNRVAKRSIDSEGVLTAALQPVALTTSFRPATGRNSLAEQLQVVARLIAARQPLGARRQVFMVSMGGFDLHDNLISNQNNLMGSLDFAMDAFYKATVELGVADKVTTFTASDFGRTLQSNGDGSDHGWGSHHFIMGGAVNGGRFYGVAPQISVNSPDQVGQGRLLPLRWRHGSGFHPMNWPACPPISAALPAAILASCCNRDQGSVVVRSATLYSPTPPPYTLQTRHPELVSGSIVQRLPWFERKPNRALLFGLSRHGGNGLTHGP
jgi:hypothetical protein